MRKRQLTSEERELWRRVTKDVQRTLPEALRPEPTAQNSKINTKPPEPKPTSMSSIAVASSDVHPTNPEKMASVVGGGDPRSSRQLGRGRVEIDATLDLHGFTQDQAYASLQQFLMIAKSKGYRRLLVITGKGKSAGIRNVLSTGSSRGILRRRFLEWIDGPFRDHVARVSPAHQRHGGAGAFYVFLKKKNLRKL